MEYILIFENQDNVEIGGTQNLLYRGYINPYTKIFYESNVLCEYQGIYAERVIVYDITNALRTVDSNKMYYNGGAGFQIILGYGTEGSSINVRGENSTLEQISLDYNENINYLTGLTKQKQFQSHIIVSYK